MESAARFVLDGSVVEIDFERDGIRPTMTLLNYLRTLPNHKGVKEGCAEGDCGACTVVVAEPSPTGKLRYKSVCSCLVFLPMLYGKQVITVENLKKSDGELHSVQEAMVETGGSQCGFCTPGIVMSLFSLYKNSDRPSRMEINEALGGNLCRCTGYKPIIEAAARSCVNHGVDQFTAGESDALALLRSIRTGSLAAALPDQLYFRPASLGEAVALKHRYPHGVVLSGATDAALRVTKVRELLSVVIDLSALQELQGIVESSSSVVIGAGACLTEVMHVARDSFPALADMLAVFGSQQIRNLATLGGSLGTASPIGDALPMLIAYDADVVLEGLNGRREVSLNDFVVGYRQTVLKPDELITSVIIPKRANGAQVRWYKISKRKDLDISTVSGAFRLELEKGSRVADIRLVYGGMAERTKRAAHTELRLVGKSWLRKTVEDAMEAIDADFHPISDARGSAVMRSIAAKNLLLKFWTDTAPGEAK